MNTRFTLRTAVHLFLEKENQLLLLRRYNTGWRDGDYSVVAGHVDGNESAVCAMIREAKEEAGIDVQPEDMQFVHVMHRIEKDGQERLDLFFRCTKWTGEIVNMEPHKCDELDWYAFERFPDNIIEYVNQAITHYKEGKHFSMFGWGED